MWNYLVILSLLSHTVVSFSFVPLCNRVRSRTVGCRTMMSSSFTTYYEELTVKTGRAVTLVDITKGLYSDF
jgi:hypothetical protein